MMPSGQRPPSSFNNQWDIPTATFAIGQLTLLGIMVQLLMMLF